MTKFFSTKELKVLNQFLKEESQTSTLFQTYTEELNQTETIELEKILKKLGLEISQSGEYITITKKNEETTKL